MIYCYSAVALISFCGEGKLDGCVRERNPIRPAGRGLLYWMDVPEFACDRDKMIVSSGGRLRQRVRANGADEEGS